METLQKNVIADVEAELAVLSTAGIARKSWEDYGEVIVVDSLKEAAAISNDYAPEHLEVNIETPDDIVEQLYNYGSLFIGGNTAEVFGDYASGTNHTPADGQSLPATLAASGSARSSRPAHTRA